MKRRGRFVVCFLIVGCLGAASAWADLAYQVEGGALAGSPDYDWWYGCSPTSAGMIMGYYDIHGYGGLRYDNLVRGGVAELSSFGNPGALANQAIASSGHVDDFYGAGYGKSGDDVYGGRSFDCLADFMGTSQDSVGNSNGSTTFYYLTNGARLYDYQAAAYELQDFDGMYGIGEYVAYAGYAVASLYTQLTDNEAQAGFSFANYVAEIDAGRPVVLHVEGHSMFGYGYGDDNTVYVRDTWNEGLHTMSWGGAYSGLNLWGVTVFEPTGGSPVPVPAAVLLGMLGLGAAGMKLRRSM